MDKNEFLEAYIFNGLEPIEVANATEGITYFSESDFGIILERAEHYGLSVYTIEARLEAEVFDTLSHDKAKKKATDPKWYTQALVHFKKRQSGLVYGATYKVSQKLLDRNNDAEAL